jgi:hypothetical protein
MPTSARRPLEEASSSDDDDDDEGSENESEVEESPIIKSLDELPSDDSVSLASDDSDDSDDSRDDDDDDNDEDDVDNDEDHDDAPLPDFMNLTDRTTKGFSLSEKLNRKNRDGVDVLKQRRERRTAALAKAKELLKNCYLQSCIVQR